MKFLLIFVGTANLPAQLGEEKKISKHSVVFVAKLRCPSDGSFRPIRSS